jgi:hypothetical protein
MKTTKKTIRANPKRLSISTPVQSKKNLLYNRDFIKWIDRQVGFLKKGDLAKLDLENLIEEIESLGKKDKRSLYSHTIILLVHLLKQEYQPNKQIDSNSWKTSISNATREIKLLIKDSPSLKNELFKIYSEAYQDARQDASEESGLSIETFPEECPWTIEERFPELITKTNKK